MKFHYYPDTDSLYIEFLDSASVDSMEVTEGVVLDFDAGRALVGIDIDRATKLANLSEVDQVMMAEPVDLSEDEWNEVRKGEQEFDKGQWVKWPTVRRMDV